VITILGVKRGRAWTTERRCENIVSYLVYLCEKFVGYIGSKDRG
jgi:hypothetical protein